MLTQTLARQSVVSGVPTTIVAADKQYAVLLLNEEQLGHIMQRPGMRQVSRRVLPAGDAYAAYVKLKRRAMTGAGVAAVVVVAAVLWAFAPVAALASVFPWTWAGGPTISTGASFSLTVASRRSADDAAAVAGRLAGLGLPAFTRSLPDSESHQVMVGPYVSLDEAERLQRRLSGHGFGPMGMFVDESLRDAPRNTLVAAPADGPGLVLVGAPGRLSLVLEMEGAPRQVSTRRLGETTLEIDIGPLDAAVRAQQWSAPEGVHLIQRVAIEDISKSPGSHYARARIALPEFSRAATRVEGRRVYVDFTWPQDRGAVTAAPRRGASAWNVGRVPRRGPGVVADTLSTTDAAAAAPGGPAGPPSTFAPRASADKPAAPAPRANAHDLLRPVVAQFAEVIPFLLSAAGSPSPDVLGALAPMLEAHEASLRAMSVTGDAAAAHGLLISAAVSARRAIAPGFAGDRLAAAHEAVGLFESAKTQIR